MGWETGGLYRVQGHGSMEQRHIHFTGLDLHLIFDGRELRDLIHCQRVIASIWI